jgi:hypothetical protein
VREWCTIFEFATKEQALRFEAALKSLFRQVREQELEFVDSEEKVKFLVFSFGPEKKARLVWYHELQSHPAIWICRVDWPRRRGKAIKDIEPEVIKLARELGGIYDGD